MEHTFNSSLLRRMAFIALPLLLLFSSCVPEPIDIQITPPEPEIVVASQILPDRVMLVALTRSFSALEIDAEYDTVSDDFLNDLLVDSAEVMVSFAGRTERLFNLGNGIYGSLNTLQFPNETYTLSVFDSATSKRATRPIGWKAGMTPRCTHLLSASAVSQVMTEGRLSKTPPTDFTCTASLTPHPRSLPGTLPTFSP